LRQAKLRILKKTANPAANNIMNTQLKKPANPAANNITNALGTVGKTSQSHDNNVPSTPGATKKPPNPAANNITNALGAAEKTC
jgi:hypothetical protein